MILLHRAVIRQVGKGQIGKGEGIWEGTEKWEPAMCFSKVNLTEACGVPRKTVGNSENTATVQDRGKAEPVGRGAE